MEIRSAASIEWVRKTTTAISPMEFEETVKSICVEKGYIYNGFVMPWDGSKTKISLTCPEHGTWNTTSIIKLKSGRSCPGCGRENNLKAIRVPESVLVDNVNAKCEIFGYTFLGFVDKPSARANLRLKCNKHNHVWENTNYNNFMKPRSIGGCPLCEREFNINRFSLDLTTVMQRINDVCATKGYEFVDFVDGWHGNESWLRVKCLEHNEIGEVRYNDFIGKETSEPCCKCRKYGFMSGKAGRFYIQTLDDKYVKFGITNKETRQRIAQQQRKSKFNHKLVYEAEFPDGSKALELENLVKKTFNTKVVPRDEMMDGWTETLRVEDLPILLKVTKTFINMNI